MRHLLAIAAALVLFVLTVALTGWADWQELRRGKNWNVTHSQQPEGELAGFRIFVDQGRAMILPAAPERAIVYLRLGAQGDPQLMREWLGCDLGLTDGQGRKWLPLSNLAGIEIVRLLGDGSGTEPGCPQSLNLPPEDGSPSFSGQAFLVPAGVLDDLRVELSGMATRPDAISLPFRPVLQPPPG